MSFNSSLERFSETNAAPSSAEKQQITAHISEAARELSQIDQAIEDATKALAAVKEKREAHNAKLQAYRGVISPLRRLPLDIIQTIFLACLPKKHNAVLSASEAPILLTHVCGLWRAVALNTPLLWSTIHIPIPIHPIHGSGAYIPGANRRGARLGHDWSEEQNEYLASEIARWHVKINNRRELISLWLQRAQQTDLSISINRWEFFRGPGVDASSGLEEVMAIVDLVRARSRQWKKLDISAHTPISNTLLSLPVSEVPNLQEIRLPGILGSVVDHTPSVDSDDGSEPEPEPTSILSAGTVVTAPSLRVIRFTILPPSVTEIPIHWSNLFTLTIESANPFGSRPRFGLVALLDLLKQCPQLRQLSFRLSDETFIGWPQTPQPVDTAETPQPFGHVLLPHLRDLEIKWRGQPAPLIQFCMSLELPSLRSVVMPTHGQTRTRPPSDTTSQPSALITLVRSCGVNLESLAFDYYELTEPQLRELFGLLTNIKHLALNVNRYPAAIYNRSLPCFSNELLAEMTPLGAGPILCPNLVSFEIELLTKGFGEEALLEFIRRRRHRATIPTIARLERVKARLYFDTDVIDGPFPDPDLEVVRPSKWPLLDKLKEDPEVDMEGAVIDVQNIDAARQVLHYGASLAVQEDRRTHSEKVWSPTEGIPSCNEDGIWAMYQP